MYKKILKKEYGIEKDWKDDVIGESIYIIFLDLVY